MNDAYAQGFLQKCAEEGVDPQVLLKAAQVWDPQTMQAARNREQAAASRAMTNAPPSEGATGRSVRRPAGQQLWDPTQQARREQATSAQAVARAPAAGGLTGYMSGVTGRSVGFKPPVRPPAPQVAAPAQGAQRPAVAPVSPQLAGAGKPAAQPLAGNSPEPSSTREVARRRAAQAPGMNVYPAQGAQQPAAAPIYNQMSAGKPAPAPKQTPAAPAAPAVPAWATASPANRAMWATRGKPAGQQASAFRSTLAGAQGLSANQQQIAGQQGGQVTPYGSMRVSSPMKAQRPAPAPAAGLFAKAPTPALSYRG